MAPVAKLEASTSSSNGLFRSGCVSTGSEVRMSIIRSNAFVQLAVHRNGCPFFNS